MSTATAFLDTNVLLHYRRLREVDWLSVLDAKAVNLVICPCVLQELDKHKETHHSSKIRRRASEVLAELDLFTDQGPTVELRPNVQLEFIHVEPQVDWVSLRLRADVPDDRLIAALLEYERERGTKCALITADAALKVKAKARQVRTIKPSDDMKLASEETPEEKRIREMEAEVRILKNRLPKLRLFFQNKQTRITFPLPPAVELEVAAMSAAAHKIRRENPPLNLDEPPKPKPEPPKNKALIKALGLDMSSFKFPEEQNLDIRKMIRPEELSNYQNKLENFYRAHGEYLKSRNAWQNELLRTVRIHLFVKNEGAAPAEDVVVKLHFPDGFLLRSEDNLPDEPSSPSPPEKPFPFGEMRSIADRMSFFDYRAPSVVQPALRSPTNVSANTIRQTRSYDVQASIKKLNHGFDEPLNTMFATFLSRESAKSFAITYEIHAANLPAPETGELQVIIERK